MSLNLEELVSSATGITDDSRKVKKGYVFVAVKGESVDGHDFIENAVRRGAKIVIGERSFKPSKGVKFFKVSDSRSILGILASEFYGNPSDKLKIIGVTGTKGKTTTSHLIFHILSKAGKKAGLVSSVMAKVGNFELNTGFHVTTPDVISLHKLLKQMVDKGCTHAVLEVSSHAIVQKRIEGINFEIGVLTNIDPEHLDYHKTLSEYKKVKMSFLNSTVKKVISPNTTSLNILPGEYNNINAETAINVAELCGISKRDAVEALSSFKLPAGRMEEVKTGTGFGVFIDFAHTPDSLEAALTYLKSITKGKLISVFGCAGGRDPGKRQKMGEISSRIADFSVFTAEDPRHENIHDVLNAIEINANNYMSIPQRGEAISFALSMAKAGDIVGIFGKGHEKSMAYQVFEHPWSDREIIEALLFSKYSDTSVIVLAAGRGSRMKSQTPKILREICGRPMLAYTLENLRRVGMKDIVVVVSFGGDLVKKEFRGNVKFALQKNSKGGTADASRAGLIKISSGSKTVVVINGDDSAFYTPNTIKDVISEHKKSKATLSFVSLEKENPKGLGRVIRNAEGGLVGIIEENDATEEQRKVKEVNDGLYVFERNWLDKNIAKVNKSLVSGEYYLVELIKMALKGKKKVYVYKLKDASEWQGINTPEELVSAEQKMGHKLEEYAA